MGLFGKKEKEEEIPALPELPKANEDLVLPSKDDLPETPTGLPKIETTELPTLPTLPPKEQPSEKLTPTISAPPEPEMQKSKFEVKTQIPIKPLKQPDLPRTIELEHGMPPRSFGKQITQKAEPIYIRLDKFETTVAAFEEIKNKITEMEILLQKTKEIKEKEEQELTGWEREIQMIKARIDAIDRSIFNKLD